jgi:hypothetical protein
VSWLGSWVHVKMRDVVICAQSQLSPDAGWYWERVDVVVSPPGRAAGILAWDFLAWWSPSARVGVALLRRYLIIK